MLTLLSAGALLILTVLAGVPIYAALGSTAVVLFLASGESIGGAAQVVLDHLDSSSLIAIPYFVLATTFLEHSRAGRILIELADIWTGWIKGGLGLACVFAALGFSTISGSSTATVIALGAILIPAMVDRGYSRDFAIGLVGASGTLGILIPPSIALIVYGYVTESSIPRLFLAGVVPGLLQVALFSVVVIFCGYRNRMAKQVNRSSRAIVRLHLEALPALAIPIMILGGIYAGIVTVTEAAALAAVLAMGVGLIVYRDIRWKDLLGLLTESVTNTARIMMIVAMSFAFSHWIISSRASDALLQAIVDSEVTAWQFLAIMSLVMLLLGMLLEVISVILITLPVILPVMLALDIDPLHYAIVVIVNMQIATITPPVGLTLFALSMTTGAPMVEVLRAIWPFLLILLLSLVIVTVWPDLSLFLPRIALS